MIMGVIVSARMTVTVVMPQHALAAAPPLPKRHDNIPRLFVAVVIR